MQTDNPEAIALISDVGGSVTPLGLHLPESLDPKGKPVTDLRQEAWANIGRQLYRADVHLRWWLGDWAAFGVRHFGLSLKDYAVLNSINYQLLRDLSWVSQRIPLSFRNDKVDWTTHREIASIKDQAEQKKWLDLAERENLSVVELRQRLRKHGAKFSASESDGPKLTFASKLLGELIAWLTGQAADFWNDENRLKWRQRLQPLVDFHKGL